MTANNEDKAKECVAFGNAVRELRHAIELSQDNFAAHANLHRTYIGGVERGERNPTLSTIIRIAAALDISPSQLLERTQKWMEPKKRR